MRSMTLVVCLLALLTPGLAGAQDQQAILEIVVNGIPKGNALVVMRQDDVLVATASLTAAGLPPKGGARERVGDEEFVSLRSLASDFTYAVEEENLRLAITARADMLGRTAYDFQTGAPADIVYSSAPSAFVNYALTSGLQGGSELFTEAAVSARGALIYNTLTTTPRGSVRGLTNVTFDERRGLRRWTLGDNFVNGGVLGGSALVGGLTLSREFSIEPYFVRFPTQSLTAAVSSPSTVEVYVNDQLIRTERVDPGLVDLRHLPLVTGQNQTRVVVRDSFGAERELANQYYVTASLLAPGLHDYQYSVGLRRSSLGALSADYGAPVAIARHRVGLTSWLTAGARLEADETMLSGGPSFNLRLPLGELEGAAAASRVKGLDGETTSRGSAYRLSYQYTSRILSAGATLGRTTGAYATSSLLPAQVRPVQEQSVFVSAPLARLGSVSLNHSLFRSSDADRREQTSITTSLRLFKNTNLIATGSRVVSALRPELQATVGLTVNLGRRMLATASATHDDNGLRSVVELQRSAPMAKGAGFELRSEQGARNVVSGAAQYQGDYGRYEVRHDGTTTTVSASGALVAIGGSVHATRPIRNSFALVQVPGVKEVRAYSSYQEVGRTDRRGNVLITDLFPYYANELSIADTDIPLDYTVDSTRVQLAPPFRGGAVITFPVARIQRTIGTVSFVSGGAAKIPAYGELSVTVGEAPVLSPIGADGQFYFDSLPSGSHAATVTFNGETCRFTLTVPKLDTDLVDLGETRCEAGGR